MLVYLLLRQGWLVGSWGVSAGVGDWDVGMRGERVGREDLQAPLEMAPTGGREVTAGGLLEIGFGEEGEVKI